VNNTDTVKRLLISGLLVFITGQVYIYPFGSDFRFSLSPIVFTFVLLYFSRLPVITAAFVVAVSVFSGRFMLEYLNHTMPVANIIVKHYPGGMFYFVSGLIFYLLDIRKHVEKPLLAIILLTSIDTMANIIELVIRNQVMQDFSIVMSSLLLVAFLRSFIAVLTYWSIKLYNVLILKKAHYNRYIELLLFISNLKSELFYLRKSMQDIEKVMNSSYSMYVQISEMQNGKSDNDLKPYKEKALALAKDIHEIKKDYQRVITGIEKLLPNPVESEKMTLGEILEIIKDNSSRYIESIGKKTVLRFQSRDKLIIKQYYSLVSILNNLIFNAIDATDENGVITVVEYMRDNNLIIKVADNGTGIPEDQLKVIFQPGYSTKYDPKTGTMSTGLGLTHVKSLVEYLSGSISVKSIPGSGTTFIIEIPLAQLTGEGE
jgi:two-component system sensor histidine kinase YcbA